MSADQEFNDLIAGLAEPRPEWQARAKCRGMGRAFSGASTPEQQAVCHGTTYPGDKPCPVKQECILWYVDGCMRLYGNELAYHNLTVHGGYDHHEILAMVKRARKNLEKGVPVTIDTR